MTLVHSAPTAARPSESSAVDTESAKQEIIDRERRLERRRRRRDHTLSIAFPLSLLLGWQILVHTGGLDGRLFPPPSRIADEAWQLLQSGALVSHLFVTLRRLVLGFSIGLVTGLVVGLAMGRSRILYATLNPTLSALYTVPKIAIFPLLLILLGLGERPKVAVVAIGVFFVIEIATTSAVRNVEPGYLEVGKAYGATGLNSFRHVVLPAALPGILASLRIAAGMSLLIIVAVEFVSSSDGLGFIIWNAWTLFQPPRMFVGLAVVSLLGATITAIVSLLEELLLPYKRTTSRRRINLFSKRKGQSPTIQGARDVG